MTARWIIPAPVWDGEAVGWPRMTGTADGIPKPSQIIKAESLFKKGDAWMTAPHGLKPRSCGRLARRWLP